MPHPARIATLLLLALAGLLAACGEAEQPSPSQALSRALSASSGLGMRVTSTGSMTIAGQRLPIRLRMTIDPRGRIKVVNETAGTRIVQYIDSHHMLMSVDGLPTRDSFPRGTRYLRMDLDRIRTASGIDSGVQDLQTIAPARLLELFTNLEDVTIRGGDSVRGVPVTRYRAKVGFADIAKAIDADHKVPNLPTALKDAVVDMELAVDGDDRLRGFDETATIGPTKIEMTGEVTSLDRALRVDLPTGDGIVDITSGVVDSIRQLPTG